MLVFLHYILQQPKDSLMHKVFEADKQNPTKGDWVSSVTTLMNRYNIEWTFLQIGEMKSTIFKTLFKIKLQKLL